MVEDKIEIDEWKDVHDVLPLKEGYYGVMYDDGTTDEKPFRIRPKKNILGFMTENNVTHWRNYLEPQDFEID